jgi:hypothetical protein
MTAIVLSTSSTLFASRSVPFEVWYHDQVSLWDLYFLVSSRKRITFSNPTLDDWNIRTKSDYPEFRNNSMKCNFLWSLLNNCNGIRLATVVIYFLLPPPFLGGGGVTVHLVCLPLFSLLYQPLKIDGECGEFSGMSGRGNRSTQRKPAPVPLCSPQIPHDLTQAWTWATIVRSGEQPELRYGPLQFVINNMVKRGKILIPAPQ